MKRTRRRSPAAPASSARNLADRLLERGPARRRLDNLVASRRRAEPRAGCRRKHGGRVDVAHRRRPRCRGRARRRVDGAARRLPSGGPGRGDHEPRRPARRLRRQPRAARSSVLEELRAADAAAAAHLHVDEQGLRLPARRALRRDDDRWRAASTRSCASTASARRARSTSARPYGCSKGGADQYVLDYAETSASRAVVFRMSCIYGPHQHGNEDQGWLAHFIIRALAGEPLTIYGDGAQVRDVLYVERSRRCDARGRRRRRASRRHAPSTSAAAHATRSACSSCSSCSTSSTATGRRSSSARRAPATSAGTSPTRAASARATGWQPAVDVEDGVERLVVVAAGARPCTGGGLRELTVAAPARDRDGGGARRAPALRARPAIPLPEPAPGQVLVRVEGCGVCASNLPRLGGPAVVRVPAAARRAGARGLGHRGRERPPRGAALTSRRSRTCVAGRRARPRSRSRRSSTGCRSPASRSAAR